MRLIGHGALVSIALVLLTLIGATAATAYWQATGRGVGAASAGTLAEPTGVSVPSTSMSSVPVTWAAAAGATTPTGYYVTRATGASTLAACGSSPATLITGTSCTDTGVPDGAYTYKVTAVYRSWTGTSAASGTVAVATATKTVFTAQPGNVPAGASIAPAVTVAVQTASGAAVPAAGIQVSVAIGTNPGAGTLSGTLTAATNSSGVATFSNLSINRAGAGYTLAASSTGLISATSTAFNVAAVARKLAFTTGAVTGQASDSATLGSITVQRQDDTGAPVTVGTTTLNLGSTGTGVFAATSGGAAITQITIPSGTSTATFFYGDTKMGTPSITVSTTGLTGASQSATITAAAASALAFGQQPTTTGNGATITPAVTVLVVDRFGNQTDDSTASVSMEATQRNLKGTKSIKSIHGMATFSDLSINGKTTGTSLVASSPGLTSATSVPFNVT
ncbi:hypothetical protein E5206_06240 [Arthrobacter sp. PAMC25564]|nr:hypothetical protein E5206_06240 [Arthrobacter sp. PAMC25564]